MDLINDTLKIIVIELPMLQGALNIIQFQPFCHGDGHPLRDQDAQSSIQLGFSNKLN